MCCLASSSIFTPRPHWQSDDDLCIISLCIMIMMVMAMMMITIIIFMIVMIMNMFSFNFIHKKSTLSDKDDKEDKIIFNIVLVHHNQHNDDQTSNRDYGGGHRPWSPWSWCRSFRRGQSVSAFVELKTNNLFPLRYRHLMVFVTRVL